MSRLLSEQQGDVLVLTFNDPGMRNAMTEELKAELLAAIDAQHANPTARAILLTGAGEAFCAGADLATVMSKRERLPQIIDTGTNRIIRRMRDLPVPIVAAVNGPAAGAGLGLALACDIIVVSEAASLILAFVRLGAAMDGGTSYFLTRLLGAHRTKALAMRGAVLDAQTALQMGLAAEVWPADDFRDRAMDYVTKLAAGPTFALGQIKKQVNAAENAMLNEALDYEALTQGAAFATEDVEIGVSAFLEKTRPVFKGR